MCITVSGGITLQLVLRSIMEFFRMLVLCILLWGDRGFEAVSLEAFPLADCGCDGRAYILFAPAYPELIHPCQLTGIALFSGVMFLMISICEALYVWKLPYIHGPTAIFPYH